MTAKDTNPQKRCVACGYETSAEPLTDAELWHYVRTGYSRFGGCTAHPWGWHHWEGEKPPPNIRLRSMRANRP